MTDKYEALIETVMSHVRVRGGSEIVLDSREQTRQDLKNFLSKKEMGEHESS